MPEFPPPRRLPGEPPLPREPYEGHDRHEAPAVVDEDFDLFGVEEVAARLAERIEQVPAGAVRLADDGRALLAPPFSATGDRVDGPPLPRASLVVFGAHGTPSSRPLGSLLAHVRERHATTVAVVWRHYPDPIAHRRAAVLALAAEAAAGLGRFWPLTREMLQMRHDDPADLHAAMLRAGVDPARAAEAMRAGTGADRIVDDVASALASGVTYTPALFVNGERYGGDLDPAAVSAALEAVAPVR
jgi:2-hydroxychromene-2-carboxylate isomerase